MLTDRQRLQVAKKYNLDPARAKCLIFGLLDQGYNFRQIRFVVGDLVKRETIRRYREEWKKLQTVAEREAKTTRR